MAGAEIALRDLPDECLLLVLRFLPVKDVLSLEQTCKSWLHLARSPEVWQERIWNSFHLKVKANNGDAQPAWQELFRHVTQTPADTSIRFRGVFTDGGVDNSLSQYWVDNLFMPKHWDSYCSSTSRNIHCIGLLMAEEDTVKRDAREAALREYMVQRCQFPAALMWNEFHGPPPPLSHEAPVCEATITRLRSWSTAELEALLAELFNELQVGQLLGQRLVQGIEHKDVQVHLLKLHHIAASVPRTTTVGQARILPASWQEDGGEAMLTDSKVFESAPAGEEQQAGVIHRLSISRAGHFSCPVACGAILVGDFAFGEAGAIPDSARADGQVDPRFKSRVEALQDVVGEPACCLLDNVTSLPMLWERTRQGCLPSVIAQTESTAGVFVEFDPNWDPASCPSTSGRDASTAEHAKRRPRQPTLRPVGWFKFWTREEAEDYKRRRLEVARKRGAEAQAELRARQAANSQALAEGAADGATTVGTSEQRGHDCDTDEASLDSAQAQIFFHSPLGDTDSSDEAELMDTGSDESDAEDLIGFGAFEGVEEEGRTSGRNKLSVELKAAHAGNLACVKLIAPEDLMQAWGDQHDTANIDINYVIFGGRKVTLPPDFRLAR